jgi:hypothetical protein
MRLPKPAPKRCVLCGSNRNVQGNHVGGRHFLAHFTMPFCDCCHPLFHAMVDRAGIDLCYTDDPIERIRRALAAIKIAEWMLLEQLKYALCKPQKENQNENSKRHDHSSTPNH